MKAARWMWLPIVSLAGLAAYMASTGEYLPFVAVAVAIIGGVCCTHQAPPPNFTANQTVRLAADPDLLARRRKEISEELALLEAAQDLQRGVFEVSAELVGCVDEQDARTRFEAAMRRYWSCEQADLALWERGSWRGMGGELHGEIPPLDAPVLLPSGDQRELVLDLSPGVDGQAALVLRGAKVQPSLEGRSPADQRYVAEVLRTQLSLSLRRVVLYSELQDLGRLDPLTGTHRRWYGESRLSELCDSGEVVAIAMVDIDLFKTVNDRFGHAVGDEVLAAVGKHLTATLRTGDLVSRHGGEEFLVILPDTLPVGALQVAERLREAVAGIETLPCRVSVSIGVASCYQDDTAAALVARADAALYEAKNGGRNRVVMSEVNADTNLRTVSRRSHESSAKQKQLKERSKTPPPESTNSESA